MLVQTPHWYSEPKDLPHYPACDNQEGFLCKTCKLYIEAGQPSRNWCDGCGMFAGKVDQCICDSLEVLHNW